MLGCSASGRSTFYQQNLPFKIDEMDINWRETLSGTSLALENVSAARDLLLAIAAIVGESLVTWQIYRAESRRKGWSSW